MGQPWFAFYTDDYDRDTADLDFIQDSAYGRLIRHYYRTGGPLPANAVQLHRICRAFADAEKSAVEYCLARYFHLESDGWHHRRCDEELAVSASIMQAKSKGGKARAGALTAEHRSEIAKAAANARWKTKDLGENKPATMLAGCLQNACHTQSHTHKEGSGTGFNAQESAMYVKHELGLTGQYIVRDVSEALESIHSKEGMEYEKSAETFVVRWREHLKSDSKVGFNSWLHSGGYLRAKTDSKKPRWDPVAETLKGLQ